MNDLLKAMGRYGCYLVLMLYMSIRLYAQQSNPLIVELNQTAFESLDIKLTYSNANTNTLSVRHIPRNAVDGFLTSLSRTNQTYTGTIALQSSIKKGIIKVRNQSDEDVLFRINYTVANKLDLNFRQKLVAGDGSAVFYPDRNTNMDKAILATYKVPTPEVTTPKNLTRMATVANVVAYPNSITSFTGTNSLAFYYNDVLDSLDELGMKIYKWTSSNSTWTLVDGCPEIDTTNNTVACYITTPGVYAVFYMPYVENTGETSKVANYTIQAQQEIKTTDVFDSSAVNVTYKAKKAITFSPGFKAFKGTKITTTLVANCTSYTNVTTPVTAFSMRKDPASPADHPASPEVTVNALNTGFVVYPNPSNNTFHVAYSVEKSEKVSITVFDLAGRQVHLVQVPTMQKPGVYNVTYNAGALKSGTYLLQINLGKKNQIRKLIKL